MAKISKEEQAKREGMSYALRVAEKEGVEGLRKELEFRNAIGLPLTCSKKDLQNFSENVKTNILYHIKILMAVTLHDEFGFGNERLRRMFKRFDTKAECIYGDYTTWDDQVMILAEECGIEVLDDTRDINVKASNK